MTSQSRPDPSAIPDVYLLAWRGDQLLLLLRSATGYNDGRWGPPSGKVEPRESYREAAARELAEETGVEVDPGELAFLHVIDRVPDRGPRWTGIFFGVDITASEPANTEPHKHADIQFFGAGSLPPTTVDYVAHVIAAVARGEAYSVWAYSHTEDVG